MTATALSMMRRFKVGRLFIFSGAKIKPRQTKLIGRDFSIFYFLQNQSFGVMECVLYAVPLQAFLRWRLSIRWNSFLL